MKKAPVKLTASHDTSPGSKALKSKSVFERRLGAHLFVFVQNQNSLFNAPNRIRQRIIKETGVFFCVGLAITLPVLRFGVGDIPLQENFINYANPFFSGRARVVRIGLRAKRIVLPSIIRQVMTRSLI